MKYYIPLFILLVSCGSGSEESEEIEPIPEIKIRQTTFDTDIDWSNFEPGVFDIAKDEGKLVFLEVGANWCHWCHVMDEKTYSDDSVQAYLYENFILCREDQDSRPDLFAAYRKWGWPAIIVLDGDANELLRLKGYQEKNEFLAELKRTVENPIPLEDETQTPSSLNASDQELFNDFLARIDHEKGMYTTAHKFLPLPGIIHGLKFYDNDSLKKWTDKTVKNSFALVDPVWGGAYQYSARKSWNHQHYEKILRIQANYIEGYARYGAVTGDKEAIENAISIYEYLEKFLKSDNALYYNSQNADVVNADDSEDYYQKNERDRLKAGVPSVDMHVYLKENTMVAKSLVYLWAATDNERYLTRAKAMFKRIIEFKAYNGLYMHEKDREGIFSMEENRQVVELFMIMYQLEGKRSYLTSAQVLANKIWDNFNSESGLVSSAGEYTIKPNVVARNNIDAVITFNKLYHLDKESNVSKYFAEDTYKKLDKARLSKTTGNLPTLLKARYELNNEPYHAVYITDPDEYDSGAKPFFKEILKHSDDYVIFEYAFIGHFTEEQELLYGGMEHGTLFMCTSSFCSAPITEPVALQEFLQSN